MKLRFKQSNEKMQEHINRIERRQALTEKRIQQLQSGVGDKPVILNTCELIDIFEVHNDNFLHMVDSFDSSIFRRYRSTAILSPYDLLYDSRLEWKIQLCTLLRFSKCPDFMISEEPQVEVEEALNYAFLSVAASDKETFDNILAAHILLTKGANINFMNPEGKTALHLATIKKKSIFCRWLLAQKQFEFSNKAYIMFLSFAINLNAKDILRSIAWFICRKLHKQYHKYCIYLDVWPGYRCHAPPYTSRLSETDMHLIAQYKEMNCEKIKEMHGIKVEWRDKDLVSSEGKYISFIEDTSSVQSVKTTNRLIQNKTVADLFKRHSNLNVVSPSTVKSQNFHDIKSRSIKSQLCIALYCRIKGFIPLDEQPFPSSINGIPTDVREGYCTFGGCGPKDVQQNLKIGCCIGPSNDITSGTLGGFVEIDNTTCFITCAHIIFDLHELSSNQCSRIVSVVQPTLPNSPHTQAQRTVGSVKNVVFSPDDHNRISVDAALVTLNTRCPSDGKFSRGDELQHKSTGYKAKRSPAFNNGRIMQTIKKKHRRKQVIKFGAESGLTIGSLNLCETHVRMENRDLVLKDYFHGTNTEKKFIMYHQYEVFSSRNTPFFVPGDSGAFVFMTVDKRTNDLQCIGMAIGQTSHITCLVTPIGALLESFGLPLQLKEFDVQMDNKKCKKKTPVSSSDNTQGLATSVQLDKMFEGFMNTFKAEMQTVKKEMKDDIGIVKQEIDSISNRLDCIENKLQNE
ncbi:hypothetical protein KUTeg_017918 [Tegillarca granosa]|uniref:ANK_REP_REGION domain-containing protein n=1 Tax=Tegillarca granosa TaxID=220873 RepID=A0ABQ9ELP5_TEGGR|nr:hypothetical protein KUTeg_017918 [Tegillarca granosa]